MRSRWTAPDPGRGAMVQPAGSKRGHRLDLGMVCEALAGGVERAGATMLLRSCSVSRGFLLAPGRSPSPSMPSAFLGSLPTPRRPARGVGPAAAD
jgi:hypothetical protein